MDAVFVAGATGLTGRHVAQSAARRGLSVVAHVRPDSPSLSAWRERLGAIARVDTTPWAEDAMRATLARERPALVFSCLGTTRARARDAERTGRDPAAESYDAVDVALTAMLAQAATESAARRFVLLSSVGAGEGAVGAYLAARNRMERAVRQSGVRYTIARPSMILGDRDVPRGGERALGKVADAGLSALGLVLPKLRDRWRSIEGRDLADALVTLALDPAWEDRVAEPEDLQALVERTYPARA